MLDYMNMKAVLEIAEGKSAIKARPIEFDGVKIERGQEIRKHAAGTYSVNHFEIVGFASSRTLVAYWDGDLNGFDEYSDDIKAMPAVILKVRGWEQYDIMSAQDVIETIRMNETFANAPTPLG